MNTVIETPIMIVNNKDQQGYKTTHGFVPFGGIFIETYNRFMYDLSETEKEMDGNPDVSYSDLGIWIFQGCGIQDIVNYIENDILTNTLRENLVNKSKTFLFQVGLYEEQPVLYFTGTESDLMLYDILMIKENSIKIKFCKDCGNAFFPNTQGLYCPRCKDLNVRNREKYQTLKKDPVRLKYTRLQQRIQKREKTETNYRLLFENLARHNKNIEWLERWGRLDKEYQRVKRYSCEYLPGMDETEWDEMITQGQIDSIDDFEKWIKSRWAVLPKL